MDSLISASVAIYRAANATRNMEQNPENVVEAEQLLKPLMVARTLNVNSSDPVAGGLVQNLTSELDNLVPGLTVDTQNGEALQGTVVGRFLHYGRKAPPRVFEPDVAHAVATLERLLRGLRASAVVHDTNPPETAEQLVDGAEGDASYWPTLAKRLRDLRRSLR
jgi:hypothetical protein